MGFGSKLKKTLKKVAKPLTVLNPVMALSTMGAVKAGGGGDPLGLFSPERPEIPGGDPNGLATSYLNYLGPGGGQAGKAFETLKSRFGNVSSVDSVRSEVDNDLMKELLGGIDRDTAGSVGGLKMDFADRGLGGPGQISDIEASGLATARTGGDRLKTGARLDFAGKQLDRLKSREGLLDQAYGANYDNATKTDQLIAQLLSGGAQNNLAASELREKYKEPSMFDKLLNKVNFGISL